MAWMQAFMGLFFCFFALFKLLDVRGFASGFANYDMIARRWRFYAYAYPFIELALGLAYLAGWKIEAVNIATLLLMAISAAGVIRTLASGRKLDCACLGTFIQVPLSVVTIVENAGMAVMAALMLAA